DLGAEGEAREDGELVRGVEAADVEGRIGLRVAQSLRLLQAGRKREPLLVHAGEDVIARSVEDAVDARNAAAAKPLAQRFHDRDTAGDRRLERKSRNVYLRRPCECKIVTLQERLCGGDSRR